jgi:hypothetical protein
MKLRLPLNVARWVIDLLRRQQFPVLAQEAFGASTHVLRQELGAKQRRFNGVS